MRHVEENMLEAILKDRIIGWVENQALEPKLAQDFNQT
jgi:hypothetical protein